MSYLHDYLYHQRASWKDLCIKFALLLAVSIGLNIGLLIFLFAGV